MRRTTIVLFAGLTVVVGVGVAVLAGTPGVLPAWLAAADVAERSGTGSVLEGWVRRVDEDRGVHVTRGLLPLSVTRVAIGADTDIRVHGKIGSIDDLREGMSVRICYTTGANGRSAIIVEVPPSDTACRTVTAKPGEPRPSDQPVAAETTPSALPTLAPSPADARAPTMSAPAPTAAARAMPDAKPAPVKSPTVAPRRSRRTVTPQVSAAPTAAPVAQPPSTTRMQSAPEREPAGPATPPPARRETREDGHDYGAVIDFLLSR